MRNLLVLMPLALVGALGSGAAAAYTCYTLYDRNDNVVYRETLPPVDMSDEGQAARDAMRARGEYLEFFEADHCPQVVFKIGDAGNVNLNVDRAVAGVTPSTPRAVPPTAPAAREARPPSGRRSSSY